MKSFVKFISFVGILSVSTLYAADKPQVELQTNKGTIVFELMPDKAPKSVENFLLYVQDGFYENTIFHRVIPDYIVQGGGYDDKQTKKDSSHPPVENESNNGVKNTKGTVAVARKNEPNSGTSQFFINMGDNKQLDNKDKAKGYTVFAKVTKGMDIVEQIQEVETHQEGAFKYFPVDPIIIEKVTLISKETPTKSDKKTDKKIDKKVEKKDVAPVDDQAAKDAAEDAADAAADQAAKKSDKKVEKKDAKSDKKTDKKAEKKVEQKTTKGNAPAPDEPAVE